MNSFKEKYRKYFLKYRKGFSSKEIIQMSYNIFLMTKNIFFIWNYMYYHIFLPMDKYNEVHTFFIINFLLKKKKFVTVPILDFPNHSINNCMFHKKCILKKNKYGILEPIYKIFLPITSIDVIFIPLLIFDMRGYRIGYGKGYYDKFMFLCKKNVLKIGLNFFHPINKIEDIHQNDLLLNIGVTPNSIFYFIKNKVIIQKF
ncbi:5-formyltetrahydrofolate cyclo-ligase [Blattabacterium cuenoti]|uniref:5-formyltetrahydrofolate cyclo-ligase n=1 Tax=Blattabacterium cuenoti TaxID=1653831 RepID=UPI00163BA79D|nr:5-formyltetrahydrofolate cyclo-ligase [Blattabacterium cuenoti]